MAVSWQSPLPWCPCGCTMSLLGLPPGPGELQRLLPKELGLLLLKRRGTRPGNCGTTSGAAGHIGGSAENVTGVIEWQRSTPA